MNRKLFSVGLSFLILFFINGRVFAEGRPKFEPKKAEREKLAKELERPENKPARDAVEEKLSAAKRAELETLKDKDPTKYREKLIEYIGALPSSVVERALGKGTPDQSKADKSILEAYAAARESSATTTLDTGTAKSSAAAGITSGGGETSVKPRTPEAAEKAKVAGVDLIRANQERVLGDLGEMTDRQLVTALQVDGATAKSLKERLAKLAEMQKHPDQAGASAKLAADLTNELGEPMFRAMEARRMVMTPEGIKPREAVAPGQLATTVRDSDHRLDTAVKFLDAKVRAKEVSEALDARAADIANLAVAEAAARRKESGKEDAATIAKEKIVTDKLAAEAKALVKENKELVEKHQGDAALTAKVKDLLDAVAKGKLTADEQIRVLKIINHLLKNRDPQSAMDNMAKLERYLKTTDADLRNRVIKNLLDVEDAWAVALKKQLKAAGHDVAEAKVADELKAMKEEEANAVRGRAADEMNEKLQEEWNKEKDPEARKKIEALLCGPCADKNFRAGKMCKNHMAASRPRDRGDRGDDYAHVHDGNDSKASGRPVVPRPNKGDDRL